MVWITYLRGTPLCYPWSTQVVYSELPPIWTPEMRPPLYSGHFKMSQSMFPSANSPLKCGHPSNQDTLTGPKGGQIRGSHCTAWYQCVEHLVTYLACIPNHYYLYWCGVCMGSSQTSSHECVLAYITARSVFLWMRGGWRIKKSGGLVKQHKSTKSSLWLTTVTQHLVHCDILRYVPHTR